MIARLQVASLNRGRTFVPSLLLMPAKPSSLPVPVLAVLGFAVTGLFSFGLAGVFLLLRPDTMAGDPVRGPVLALTHLITLGWIGSLLFAAAYLVGPLLAGTPLWSRRLAGGHLVCHGIGLVLMLGGLFQMRYDVAGIGATVLFAGLVAMVLNLMITGTKQSLWNPANVAFQSAMFWLAITGGVALFMLRARLGGSSPLRPEALIALHAHFALFGFLAQTLLAVSLRMLPALLGAPGVRPRFEFLAWGGWAALNGGLMLLVPVMLMGSDRALFVVGLIVLLGVLGFALHHGSVLWTHRRSVSWPAATLLTGLFLLLVLAVAALWRLRGVATGSFAEPREWMRFYISLALLGPFSLAILGIGQFMIPRLVWRLRFGPWADHAELPAPGSLARPAAGAPALFAVLLAWVYFALGQWYDNASAIRLGAILLLLGFAWFVFCIAPAIMRLVLGVTPADFTRFNAQPRTPSAKPEPLL